MSVSSPAPSMRVLCDRVLGNVASLPAERFAGKTADPIVLTWLDCTRRAFRKPAKSGREVGVLLPLGQSVSDGDVLFEDATSYVVAEVRPCTLWLIDARTPAALANVALELGNLHVPVQVTEDGQLLTPPDGPTEAVLRKHSATYRECTRIFTPLRATVTSGLSVAKSSLITATKPLS